MAPYINNSIRAQRSRAIHQNRCRKQTAEGFLEVIRYLRFWGRKWDVTVSQWTSIYVHVYHYHKPEVECVIRLSGHAKHSYSRRHYANPQLNDVPEYFDIRTGHWKRYGAEMGVSKTMKQVRIFLGCSKPTWIHYLHLKNKIRNERRKALRAENAGKNEAP